ncbi:asparagine synthase [Candidatus Scalindua japonica]|uniref:asparagine synthase (glutamine-hydrolyzing) n=1 Tax=Candidatus Scalindua japonica TaxID=1284222 RepID=A0A286U440_9BACT|nr:asparagine synthase (glutamine-hydrolyzing) [Candidatus Scalindua japonica]GAX62930.1 asparagine synthase [Candidatus Scalindua japonica]
MCGILGMLNKKYNIDEATRHRFNSALKTINHRGPDDHGELAIDRTLLGHARLSILDISRSGHQPMTDINVPNHIVYNGEIYNYKEIKTQIASNSYRSETDTEVVLRAYCKWGEKAFACFNGMFAFAILDEKQQLLYLVRDRFGIKPLYIYEDKHTLVFSSEIKAIKKCLLLSLELNYEALHEWLYYGNTLGERTLFKNVKKLLPGSYYKINLRTGEGSQYFYWKPEMLLGPEAPLQTEYELINTTRDLLESAVKRQLVSDVPVGIFLSGGIDSSAITAFASRHYAGVINTYSAGFDYENGINELPKARLIAERYKTNHQEIHISGQDVPHIIETLIDHHDLPFSDAANIPLYLICGKVNGSSKVILQGDGGDEIFGGYRRYNTLYWRALWQPFIKMVTFLNNIRQKKGSYYSRRRYLNALSENDFAVQMALLLTVEDVQNNPLKIFSKESRKLVSMGDPFLRYRRCHERFSGLDPVHEMLMTDTQIILPDIFLEKVDRATMAFSIEVRVPFLDHDLVDYILPLPGKIRIKKSKKKFLLKKALSGLVPDEILYGPKVGFSVPFGYWLKTSLKKYFIERIEELQKKGSGLLDYDNIKFLHREHCEGRRNHEFLLWKVLNISIWANKNRF